MPRDILDRIDDRIYHEGRTHYEGCSRATGHELCAAAEEIRELRERLRQTEQQRDETVARLHQWHGRAAEFQHQRDALDQTLRNLLAAIHRDGGHYAEEHELEKATEEAKAAVNRERVRLDALREAGEALAEAASRVKWEGPQSTSAIAALLEALRVWERMEDRDRRALEGGG